MMIGARSVEVGGVGILPIIKTLKEKGCVDPRTPENEDHTNMGAMRVPGASMGTTMVLMSRFSELHPCDAVDIVADFERKQGRMFNYHTAQNHGEHGLGCGHILNGAKNPSEYGIGVGKVIQAMEHVGAPHEDTALVRGVKKKFDILFGRYVEVPVLTGNHQETCVVKVTGTSRTVAVDNSIFRVDVTRIENDYKQLASFLAAYHLATTAEDLIKISNEHADVSLHALAEGKPIYAVALTGLGIFWPKAYQEGFVR